ncbi:MAG TPA: tellurite resistance/C4-dicarboxylate transporter family protein [Jatrophihabitans sp.]|nr:tellurite resistance/C4-dicarboxylate transporter family protein [Jatrophihabitans sp.]
MHASGVAGRLANTDLPPDVFAVVMATGIVSVAARDHRYPRISDPLAGLAAAAFVLLALGLIVRVIARPHSAVREIRDPDVALRMFTSVAACTVLGARFVERANLLWALGALAVAAWLVLVPLAIADVASRARTDLRDHAHGAWLLPSVATAGLAITAADLAVHARSDTLVAVGCVAWLIAIGIYVAVLALIAWRALAAPFRPDLVTPDSWILMGALAISALAGSRMLHASRALAMPDAFTDTVHYATLIAWIVASLWVPVLLYAEGWSVDHRTGSLHYTRVWWSAVFPIGMYSAATHEAAVELSMRSLRTISLVMFWIGFAIWLMVAIGWLHTALREVIRAAR